MSVSRRPAAQAPDDIAIQAAESVLSTGTSTSTPGGPRLEQLDPARDGEVIAILLQSLVDARAAVCVCDDKDQVRYANAAFATAFFSDLADRPTDFCDGLAAAIGQRRGIRLQSVALEDFVPRIRERRRVAGPHHAFAVDMWDGSWWWVNDHKLDNGWMLVVASDITSVKDEEFRLRHAHAAAMQAAQTDYLTGLANRRHGFERAEVAMAAFHDNRLPVTIALIDIDHFKQINDLYGHDSGDKVLVQFSGFAPGQLAPRDQISRIGGEEFLVVLPETSARRARDRVEAMLRRVPPLQAAGKATGLRYTMSAGIAAAQPFETLAALLHRADLALYEAKAKGRHRVEVSRAGALRAPPAPNGRPALEPA